MKQNISFFSVLIIMMMFPKVASAFSAVSPSGHTIYYEIVGNTAKIVPAVGIGIHDLTSSRYPGLSGNVILPDSIIYNGGKKAVTAIDDLSFCSCTSLVTITLPSGLQSIGSYAFYNCSSLTSISIPNTVTMVDTYAFKGCQSMSSVTLSNAVNTWGAGVFQGCSSISSCIVPEGITQIGLAMFCDCHQLENVSLPSTLISIGQAAFENCFEMSNISLPNSLETIQPYAFVNCTTLTSILIPASVISIASTAFSGCISLLTIQVSPDNTVYDSRQNCNAIIETISNKLVKASIEAIIPEGITTIGDYAISFSYTNENGTGCASIPTSIVIPSSVTTIGYNTLNCFEKIFFKPTTPPSLFNNNLGNYYTMCYVPCESYNQYRNSLGPNVFISLKSFYFDVIVLPDDTVHGNCNIITFDDDIPISCDSSTIIEVTSNYGYHFERWSNGRMQSRDTLTITCDTSITAIFQKNSYHVLGSPNYEDRGAVIGSDTVEYLDSVTLFANPSYGYHFVRWSDFCIENPYTVLANQNKELTAIFATNTYEISVKTNDSICGVAFGSGTFDYLTQINITASPFYGYHFTQWNDAVTDNPRTITLTQDTSFTAFFAINTYIVSVQSSDTIRGSVTGGTTTEYLNTTTISATANYGYLFSHWNDGNTDNPRTIQVTNNATYTAYFDYDQFTLTVQSDNTAQGNVCGGGNYNYLSNRTITATANHGYHFTQWNDGVTDNPRTITLTQDTSFSAFFGINTYTISVQSSDTIRGSVAGGTTAEYLDSTAISATANYGYHFSHWNDGNTNNPRTVQVTDNTTYTAYFDYDQFTLTVQSDNTTQGNVSGSGSYNYLSNCTITATPTYGHHFTYWNDGVTDNPRTLTMTQDTTFTAHFAPNQYTLTVNAGEHGTATGSGTYNFGDTITIQAFPEEHYHFTRWNDGNTENPRQYCIEDNITLTALFVIDTYTVNVVSSDIIRGMVEASGTEFVYGTPCTVTATAYTGYTFAGWSNGITANPYTFAVISDVELTAIFVEEGEEGYTVTVESADPTMGSVSGGGQALNGGTLIIRAIPNDGYRFRCWNDGNTENPRTVIVAGDITYTAYFESTQGIEDIDGAEIKIYTTEGRIVVESGDGEPLGEVRVFDVMGRNVVAGDAASRVSTDGANRTTFEVPASGAYIVKIGNRTARKIVVIR